MIVKITRGSDMAGALRYLMTDKAEVARENPHVVSGLGRDGEALDAGSLRGMADQLDAPRVLSGTEVRAGHVWHCSLAFDQARDGVLSEAQRQAVAEDFMRRMNLGAVRWVAVHHGPNSGGHDHVHILANLVREDGRAANVWRDFDRASDAATAVERAHGLHVVEARELGIGGRGYRAAERGVAVRQGRTETQRQYLERAVRGCMVSSRGPDEFAEQLARGGGIEVRWRVRDGQRVGYSVVGADGVLYAGGKLARDLAYPRLREHWQRERPQTADQAAQRAAGRVAHESLRAEPEGRSGPLGREARELGRFAQTRPGVPLVLGAVAAAALRQRIAAAEAAAEESERERTATRQPWLGRSRQHDRGVEMDR